MKNQCPRHPLSEPAKLAAPLLSPADPFGRHTHGCPQCTFTFLPNGDSLFDTQGVAPPKAISSSDVDTKDTNPKDAIGCKKLPLHLVPSSGIAMTAMAFVEGALKYGKYNWRVAGVRNSIYLDAMKRHYEKYLNGEDVDLKTGVSHLASICACAMIIMDARLCGKLTDDRPPRAPVGDLIDLLAEDVARLQALFKDHHPHQHTIADGQKDVS